MKILNNQNRLFFVSSFLVWSILSSMENDEKAVQKNQLCVLEAQEREKTEHFLQGLEKRMKKRPDGPTKTQQRAILAATIEKLFKVPEKDTR